MVSLRRGMIPRSARILGLPILVIEFPSYNEANSFYNSNEYQEAHEILKGHAIRHHQTIEGT